MLHKMLHFNLYGVSSVSGLSVSPARIALRTPLMPL